MKKILLLAALVLPMMVLTSCTKGEFFFDGKWQYFMPYEYKTDNGEYLVDVGTYVYDIAKKDHTVKMTGTFPKRSEKNVEYNGTYKVYSDYEIGMTFKDENGKDLVEVGRIIDGQFYIDGMPVRKAK